jgi:exonuclease VII large subunit
MNTQVFTVSISTMTPSKSDTAVVPDILEEIRQIKEQNVEILRLMRGARDRRWHNLQDAGERLDRAAWTLRQLCSHGRIRANKGEDGQWRISADELARLEEDGVPKLPQRSAK